MNLEEAEEVKNKALRIIILALIAVTVAFIFTQSLLPSHVSSSESNGVKGFLATIFPEDTPLGAFISTYVRKIAHFVEFGLLGAELTTYAFLFGKDRKRAVSFCAPIAFGVAFADETLQIFSGRGPMVSDVWLDFSGALCFGFATYFVCMLIERVIIKKAGAKNG